MKRAKSTPTNAIKPPANVTASCTAQPANIPPNEKNKPRLFNEGFSTGGSTSFGLFLTKKMIDVYGWTIEENGEPGKGAKFTMTIPKLNKNGEENYQIRQCVFPSAQYFEFINEL